MPSPPAHYVHGTGLPINGRGEKWVRIGGEDAALSGKMECGKFLTIEGGIATVASLTRNDKILKIFLD